MKDHPYTYVTPDNFELIKATISMGISTGKTPDEISQIMAKSTGLDQTICFALVQAELLPTLEELEEKNV